MTLTRRQRETQISFIGRMLIEHGRGESVCADCGAIFYIGDLMRYLAITPNARLVW